MRNGLPGGEQRLEGNFCIFLTYFLMFLCLYVSHGIGSATITSGCSVMLRIPHRYCCFCQRGVQMFITSVLKTLREGNYSTKGKKQTYFYTLTWSRSVWVMRIVAWRQKRKREWKWERGVTVSTQRWSSAFKGFTGLHENLPRVYPPRDVVRYLR